MKRNYNDENFGWIDIFKQLTVDVLIKCRKKRKKMSFYFIIMNRIPVNCLSAFFLRHFVRIFLRFVYVCVCPYVCFTMVYNTTMCIFFSIGLRYCLCIEKKWRLLLFKYLLQHTVKTFNIFSVV